MVEDSLSMGVALTLIHNMSVAVCSCDPSTWEVKAGGSEVQGYLHCIVNFRLAWATQDPVSIEKENKQKPLKGNS